MHRFAAAEERKEVVDQSFESMIALKYSQNAFEDVLALPLDDRPINAQGKRFRLGKISYNVKKRLLMMKPKQIEKFHAYWDLLRSDVKERISMKYSPTEYEGSTHEATAPANDRLPLLSQKDCLSFKINQTLEVFHMRHYFVGKIVDFKVEDDQTLVRIHFPQWNAK